MAALYERLMGDNTDGRPKIPVHQFCGMVAEQQRTAADAARPAAVTDTSAANVIAAFGLDATEQTEVTDLIAAFTRATRPLTGTVVHDVLLCAEAHLAPFSTAQAVRSRFEVATR
jgi:hypothetical protein